MPIDPSGTAPGLTPTKPAEATINMKCRNPKCPNITAVEIKVQKPGMRVYRCTKCNHTWVINVGGKFEI